MPIRPNGNYLVKLTPTRLANLIQVIRRPGKPLFLPMDTPEDECLSLARVGVTHMRDDRRRLTYRGFLTCVWLHAHHYADRDKEGKTVDVTLPHWADKGDFVLPDYAPDYWDDPSEWEVIRASLYRRA